MDYIPTIGGSQEEMKEETHDCVQAIKMLDYELRARGLEHHLVYEEARTFGLKNCKNKKESAKKDATSPQIDSIEANVSEMKQRILDISHRQS